MLSEDIEILNTESKSTDREWQDFNLSTFPEVSSVVDLNQYKQTIEVYDSVITIVISVADFLLIGIISTSSLRHKLLYQLMVCTCTFDAVKNLLIHPLYVDFIKNDRRLGCFLHLAAQVTDIHLDQFVQLWYVTLILGFCFFRQQLPGMNIVLRKNCRTFLTTLFLTSPVTVGFVILPSLLLSAIRPDFRKYYSPDDCLLYITDQMNLVVSTLIFFMPTFIATAFVTYSGIDFLLKKTNSDADNKILLDKKSRSENVFLFVPSWLVVTGLAVPDQILNLKYGDNSFLFEEDPFLLFEMSSFMDRLRLAILPIMWMMLPDVRTVLQTKFMSFIQCICVCFSSSSTSDSKSTAVLDDSDRENTQTRKQNDSDERENETESE